MRCWRPTLLALLLGFLCLGCAPKATEAVLPDGSFVEGKRDRQIPLSEPHRRKIPTH